MRSGAARVVLAGERQLVSGIERFGASAALHVVAPLCPVDSSPYDHSASAALIGRARETTRAWIRDGGLDRLHGVSHEPSAR